MFDVIKRFIPIVGKVWDLERSRGYACSKARSAQCPFPGRKIWYLAWSHSSPIPLHDFQPMSDSVTCGRHVSLSSSSFGCAVA